MYVNTLKNTMPNTILKRKPRKKICHKIKAVGLPEAELLSLCDVVIAIGGDGSLIHAARKAVKYKKADTGRQMQAILAFMAA